MKDAPESEWESPPKGRLDGPLMAVAAAALVHVVLGMALLPEPMFDKYPALARLLGEGRLSGAFITDASPGYLLLTLLLGPQPLILVQRWAGVGLVLAAAVASRRLTVARWAPALAGWVTALAAPLLLYEAVLEPDVLIAVASFSGILALPWKPGRAGWRRILAAGLAIGVATALRPSVLLLLAAAVLMVWWRDRQSTSGMRLTRPFALLVLGLAIGASPGAILSAHLQGDAKAVMSVGQVVNMGNRPEATGNGASMLFLAKNLERQLAHPDRPDHSHEIYRQLAAAGSGDVTGPFSAERYWIARSLAWARHFPGDYAALALNKLLFLFGPEPAHDITPVRERAADLMALPAWLLWPGGLAGFLFLGLRRRLPFELFALLGASTIHVLLFYVSSRYRLPLVPFFAVVAVTGTAHLLTAVRATGQPQRIGVVALAAMAVALLPGALPVAGWTASVQERAIVAGDLMREFEAAFRRGERGVAADRAAAAVAAHPGVLWTRNLGGLDIDDPRFLEMVVRRTAAASGDEVGRFLYGLALRRAGHFEEAAAAQERMAADSAFSIAIFDRLWDPSLEAARCRMRLGQTAQAKANLERVGRQGALEVLALASLFEGPREHGDARSLLFAIHDRSSGLLALGREALVIGHPERAVDPLAELVGHLPDAAIAHWYAGVAHEALYGSGAGEAQMTRARTLFPQYAFTRAP